MKKRVLSLFLAFVLSFSMMPMSAFAEEAGTVTEQEAQSGEDTVEVFPTGEDTVGVSTSGEDTVEVPTTGEDISGGNAVCEALNGLVAVQAEHEHRLCDGGIPVTGSAGILVGRKPSKRGRIVIRCPVMQVTTI